MKYAKNYTLYVPHIHVKGNIAVLSFVGVPVILVLPTIILIDIYQSINTIRDVVLLLVAGMLLLSLAYRYVDEICYFWGSYLLNESALEVKYPLHRKIEIPLEKIVCFERCESQAFSREPIACLRCVYDYDAVKKRRWKCFLLIPRNCGRNYKTKM